MHPYLPFSGQYVTSGKSASPYLLGFGEHVKGLGSAGLGSGWEQQEDLAVQSAAATATEAREGTVLPWLCTLPWKQSWIFNGDACMHVDVNPPSAVLVASPPAAPVLAGYAALRPVGARGIHTEGPSGAGGYRREDQGRPERKGLTCSLGPGKQRTTSAETVGTKGA